MCQVRKHRDSFPDLISTRGEIACDSLCLADFDRAPMTSCRGLKLAPRAHRPGRQRKNEKLREESRHPFVSLGEGVNETFKRSKKSTLNQ
jgi:hypothetical protein